MSQERRLVPLSGLQRLQEGGLILCCMFAAFMLLALISFSPSDPGWSQSSYHGDIHNLAGAVGAWLADFLFYFFGFTASFIPVVIASLGWLLFKKTYKLLEIDYFSVALRLIGFLLILVSLAALASMNANDIYGFSAGGVTGDVVSSSMLPYFNLLGTTLLLLCFVGTGFTLLTGVSLLTVIDFIGYITIKGCQFIQSLFKSNAQKDEKSLSFLSIMEKFNLKRESTACDASGDDDSPALNDSKKRNNLVNKISALFHFKRNKEDVDGELDTDKSQKQSSSHRIEPELESNHIQNDSNNTHAGLDELNSLDNVNASTKMDVTGNHYADFQQTDAMNAKVVDGVITLAGKQMSKPKPSTPLPDLSLLDVPNRSDNPISEEELQQVARSVESKLADFNIIAEVKGVYPGPVVTRFELELAPGVKASKVSALSNDLARSLLASRVRVVEVIPGKSYVGLELPNKFRETVYMRDVLDCDDFKNNKSNLTMVLGADIAGDPVVVDLGKMPHLLVAGTTGSGKSVGVNVMITSLLYKSHPDDVRFIMIDPKMLELSVYEGIPHLLCEVVTDMKEAANALRWCVGEMERRYKLMSKLGVRNLKGYNAKILEAQERGQFIPDPLWQSSESLDDEAPALEKLPSIVVVVDEFADMMMIVGKKVEELIARIAQKARAAGIHLILATQRPSVDVITGLIKANIPTRMAFQVSSKIDSRTILDQQGAETLLGMGDMLYLPPGTSVPTRVHGAFIDDHEVHKVVADWCARGKPQYITDILQGASEGEQVLLPGEMAESDEDIDPLYDEAVMFVTETRRASISSVQRKFKIGYNRAARMVEQMESQGVVTPQGHNGNREVLAPPPVTN